MKIFAETDRILLREIVVEDAAAMFEMDADPEVHRYLGNSPIESIDEAVANILFIRKQYEELGIGRWAIVEKESGAFVGWGGMKFRTDEVNGYQNYYDVGYRLLRRHWGKGYATESAKASVDYGFSRMEMQSIYAMAHVENLGSINALQKTGLKITGQVEHEGILCHWFEISKQDWLKR